MLLQWSYFYLNVYNMKANMGKADSIIRYMTASAIVLIYIFNIVTGTLAILLAWLADLFIITGFARFCPLYALFRFHTLPTKYHSKH